MRNPWGKRDMNRQPSFITGIIPTRRRCTMCKKRRVRNHHHLCDKCWNRKNLVVCKDKY